MKLGGILQRRLLSPSLSSTPSGGEGAQRAGEEVSIVKQPVLIENWYNLNGIAGLQWLHPTVISLRLPGQSKCSLCAKRSGRPRRRQGGANPVKPNQTGCA